MSSRICIAVVCVLSSSLALHIPAIHGRQQASLQGIKNSVIPKTHSDFELSGGETTNASIQEPLRPEPLQENKNPLLIFQGFDADTRADSFQQHKKLMPVSQQSNGLISNIRIFHRAKRERLLKPGSIPTNQNQVQYSNGHDNDSTLQREVRNQLQVPNILQIVSRQSKADANNVILQRVKRQQYYKLNIPSGVTQPQPFCTKFLCRRPSATKSGGRLLQLHCPPGARFDRKANSCRRLI